MKHPNETILADLAMLAVFAFAIWAIAWGAWLLEVPR